MMMPRPSQHTQQQHQEQQAEQHSAALSAAIMAGLKPVLLDTDPAMQLLGCRVLAAAATHAPALLLQQLLASDAAEHLFEVLRGTLASCSMSASILELQQRQQQQGAAVAGPAAAAAVADAAMQSEGLQSAAVAALHCLVTQGEGAVLPCCWRCFDVGRSWVTYKWWWQGWNSEVFLNITRHPAFDGQSNAVAALNHVSSKSKEAHC